MTQLLWRIVFPCAIVVLDQIEILGPTSLAQRLGASNQVSDVLVETTEFVVAHKPAKLDAITRPLRHILEVAKSVVQIIAMRDDGPQGRRSHSRITESPCIKCRAVGFATKQDDIQKQWSSIQLRPVATAPVTPTSARRSEEGGVGKE